MSKVKNIINRLIEGPELDTTGLSKTISKKESSITKTIREFLQSNFKKTKITLINCTGEVWEINLEAPVKYGETETGIQKRETAKNVAYDHRDALQKFIENKYNFTPCSVGGIDAQGNTCKFLIQFTLRNLPGKELVESLLRESDNSEKIYDLAMSSKKNDILKAKDMYNKLSQSDKNKLYDYWVDCVSEFGVDPSSGKKVTHQTVKKDIDYLFSDKNLKRY